jgi:hypothetical protein
MNCEIIDNILRELKVNSAYAIRGKNKAIDKIHAEHLKEIDTQLSDVRIFVAKLSTGYSTDEALKLIDEFLYKKQVS